jgi:U2 small nuclear ribonucleoprotein A'
LLLRGYKIPSIENLGGTNDAYECIDLSDNDLIKLGNFPPLKRLRVLLLTNNRISRFAEDCFHPLPNILSITLTGNKLEKLVDLEPLTKLKTLERLSLLENPVTKVKHYRPFMINKCSKNLRILDFNRIKDKERKASGLLFAGERGRKLLEEIAPARTVGSQTTEKAQTETARVGPSPEVIERIKKAIAEAETIEEVTRLERALKSGVLPEDLKDPEKVEGPAEKPAEEVEAPAEAPAQAPAQAEAAAAEPTDEKKEPADSADKMDVDEEKKEEVKVSAAEPEKKIEDEKSEKADTETVKEDEKKDDKAPSKDAPMQVDSDDDDDLE